MALELAIGCGLLSSVIGTALTEHLFQRAQCLEIEKVPQDASHCVITPLSTG